MSRNRSSLFTCSASASAFAPRSPSPFHARLRRTTLEVLSASARAAAPSSRMQFHEKSTNFISSHLVSIAASATAPSSSIPLSDKSSLVIERFRVSASAKACAPKSPIALPRSESSVIAEGASARERTAQPRDERLLKERSRSVSSLFSAIALTMWSSPPASGSTPSPSWLSSRSRARMHWFFATHSKSARPPTAPSPRCLRDTLSLSTEAMNCCTGMMPSRLQAAV
mmetsp:Transcript_10128/g.24388  ORF Transcript_10128/g.24388 Transcript_10128/m.24388 type:complete len:227 (-) Transcript_10128:225-905(-)